MYDFGEQSCVITIERIGGQEDQVLAVFDTDDYNNRGDGDLVIRDSWELDDMVVVQLHKVVQVKPFNLFRFFWNFDDGTKVVKTTLLRFSKVGHRITINEKNVLYPPPVYPGGKH
jgi:hypothetical protein